jgi:hypothetical protein
MAGERRREEILTGDFGPFERPAREDPFATVEWLLSLRGLPLDVIRVVVAGALGKSDSEIAAEFGISVTTVERRRRRARDYDREVGPKPAREGPAKSCDGFWRVAPILKAKGEAGPQELPMSGADLISYSDRPGLGPINTEAGVDARLALGILRRQLADPASECPVPGRHFESAVYVVVRGPAEFTDEEGETTRLFPGDPLLSSECRQAGTALRRLVLEGAIVELPSDAGIFASLVIAQERAALAQSWLVEALAARDEGEAA